jgi:hypothetical protein
MLLLGLEKKRSPLSLAISPKRLGKNTTGQRPGKAGVLHRSGMELHHAPAYHRFPNRLPRAEPGEVNVDILSLLNSSSIPRRAGVFFFMWHFS